MSPVDELITQLKDARWHASTKPGYAYQCSITPELTAYLRGCVDNVVILEVFRTQVNQLYIGWSVQPAQWSSEQFPDVYHLYRHVKQALEEEVAREILNRIQG